MRAPIRSFWLLLAATAALAAPTWIMLGTGLLGLAVAARRRSLEVEA